MYINTIKGIIDEFKVELNEKNENFTFKNVNKGVSFSYKNEDIGSFYYRDEQEYLVFEIKNKDKYVDVKSGEIDNEIDYNLDVKFSDVNDINDFAQLITKTENKIIKFKRAIEDYEYFDISKKNINELANKFGDSLISTTHKKYLTYETNIPYSNPHAFSSNILYKDKLDDIRMINIYHSYDQNKNFVKISFDSINLGDIHKYDRDCILSSYHTVKNSLNEIFDDFCNSLKKEFKPLKYDLIGGTIQH